MSAALWFKSEFVAPILKGQKTDTIRKDSDRLPVSGEIVSFSVGPRPAFARALIVSVAPVSLSDLDPERRAQVVQSLGKSKQRLVRLTFSVCR